MNNWTEELLTLTTVQDCDDPRVVFRRVEKAARELGFEYCAYGLRTPLPLTNPKMIVLSNYPSAWQARYTEAGYLEIDPTILHGRRNQHPLIWSDAVFANAPQLWEEAQAAGLRVGWTQSILNGFGVTGILTLARSVEPLTSEELAAKELKMRLLVSLTHTALARVLARQVDAGFSITLTPRETEVLKWHADGKTSNDISEILTISIDTVKFHTKNAVLKLGAANKTAAAVRATMLGLLH